MSAALVTILIPTRYSNRWPLELTLRTVRKYTDIPHRIVVGDAGADEDVKAFLAEQADVSVVSCPDPLRPKDHLARVVETPFFAILHDDAQILRPDWLTRRLRIMERRPNVAVVGRVGNNFEKNWRLRRFVHRRPCHRRLFPLALLVRRAAQDELGLLWGSVRPGHEGGGPAYRPFENHPDLLAGRIKGFDNGGVAYQQLVAARRRWSWVDLNYKSDLRHWTGMTWPLREAERVATRTPRLREVLGRRDARLAEIRHLLETGAF